MRVASVSDIDDILNGSTVGSCDDAECGYILRERFFVFIVEQALLKELFLQLFETFVELSNALLFNAVGIELILAVALVNTDLAGDYNTHALCHIEFEPGDPFSCEHYTGDLPAAVLQGKVNMP